MTYNFTITQFENIEIVPNRLNVLQIDNYMVLDYIQFELFSRQTIDNDVVGEFINLFKGYNYLDYQKEMVLIPELMSFDLNDRKIQGILLKQIVLQTLDDERVKLDQINTDLNAVINQLVLKYDVPLSFTENETVEELLKFKKIVIDKESIISYSDKMFELLEIISEFMSDNLIILFNVLPHFGQNQLKELSEFIKIKEVNILLIERDINIDRLDLSNLIYHKIDRDLVLFDI